MGDGAIVSAISEAVRKLEEELGLPEDSLLSGISILEDDSSFENEDEVRESFLTSTSSVNFCQYLYCLIFFSPRRLLS